jgi:outer membrane protein assembly factor BamA
MVAVGPMVRLGAGASLAITGVFKQVHTESDSTRFIFRTPRYGVQPHFDQAGFRAVMAVDRRDHPLLPRHGARLDLGLSYYPGVLDVHSPFGRLSASVSGAVTPTFLPAITLAGRVAGVRTFGTYPLHEAAMLGGSTTLRSHKNGRFAGDASLLASLDTRVRLGGITLRDEPWDVGVYALSDLGRVFFEPERSSRWHHSVGGGVWLSPPDHRAIGRVELATGDDGVGFRLGTGFRF